MNYAMLLQMAAAMYGQDKANQMTQAQLDLFGQQLAKTNAVPLPNTPEITPDQLGQSNVGAMEPDQAMRSKQLDAIAELQNIIDQGGLNYGDKAALEQATQSAANQQHRAMAGVAGDAAARGQLNSGNRLLMDMSAATSGADAARETGLQTAAQAQARKLAAINDAAGMEGNLRNQDWGEESQTASAKDARDQLNAAAREKAQYYNAGLPQQQFADEMQKTGASGAAAGNLAGAYANAGNNAMNQARGISNVVGSMPPTGGTTSTYTPNPDNLTTLATANQYPSGNPQGGSDPTEWVNPFPTDQDPFT